jgi:hypothetical protein
MIVGVVSHCFDCIILNSLSTFGLNVADFATTIIIEYLGFIDELFNVIVEKKILFIHLLNRYCFILLLSSISSFVAPR